MDSRGEDVRGAVAQVCRDAARLLREGQAARAYSGLVSASRSLPMTPRLAAVLVRCSLRAGTERAVITLLDAAMVTERGEVRRAVRRQLSRVLRRTGQEARAAAVLNGLLMDAPDDARARFVLDVLRERVAKAKEAASRQPPAEDDESRTKTVEVSALALSDPELGNTVVEMPVVSVPPPPPPAWTPRADTVQVPLGEWANPGRTTARGPEFPWDDDGPGKARVATPPRGARSVPEPASSVAVVSSASAEARGPEEKPAAGEKAPDRGRAGDGAQALSDQGTAASGASSPAGTMKVLSSEDAAPMAAGEASSADAAPKSERGVPASGAVQESSSAVGTSAGPRDAALAPEGTPGEASAPSPTVGRQSSSSAASTEDAPERAAAARGTASSSGVPEHVVAALSALLLSDASSSPERAGAASNASSPTDGSPASAHAVAAANASSSADGSAALEHGTKASGATLSVDAARSSEHTDAAAASSSPGGATRTPEAVAAVSNASPGTAAAPEVKDVATTTEAAASVVQSPEVKAVPLETEASAVTASDTSTHDGVASSEEKAVAARPLFEATQVFGKRLEDASLDDVAQALDEKPASPPRSQEALAAVTEAPSKNASHDELASARSPGAVLVPGAPSKAIDEDASTSEVIPPRPTGPEADAQAKASAEDISTSEVLPPRSIGPEVGAQAKASTEDISTSEVLPPRPTGPEADAQAKASTDDASTSEVLPPRPIGPEADAQVKASGETASTAKQAPLREPDALLVPGAPSKAFDADEATSEVIPPPATDAATKAPATGPSAVRSAAPHAANAVLVPGAPAMAFDDEESTSEIIPPERAEAEKDASAATPPRDEKPAAPRRASVLVPATSKPAFDEDEATSEVVLPQSAAATPDASPAAPKRTPSVKSSEPAAPPAPDASSARTAEEGAERAQSQRQEAQLIARRAWRELAQLYLKRADRAKDAPERAEALTRLAEVMENELQDSAGAARMYREIVELTGERTALREQVRLLSQREDASLVRRALDDAISRARTSRARAVALLTRGERQLNMGNAAKAREDFEAADALVPGMLPVLAGLVRSVSDEERFAQVERLRAACAAAARRTPDRLEALRVLAQTAEESLGDLRIAQWAWAEVLAENPDNDQPREHLLALARRLGDLPALSALLHAQLAREPRGPAARKAHLERVATLEAMGDAGAALAELRQAVRFEPGHKEAWLLLADRCTEREQFGEAAWALENAATATEDDEERQHTWERLALFCREVLNNTEKARLYARRAESLRKSREQRARPPAPEPARPAPAQAVGVPPPSVLVAPPVATGRVTAKRKDLSDEVTSNTDVPSLLQAEEAAPGKRVSRAKDGAGRKTSVSSNAVAGTDVSGEGKRGRAEARSAAADRAPRKEPGRATGASPDVPPSTKAPSGSHAPVADTAANPRRGDAAKAAAARNASGGETVQGTEAQRRPAAGKTLVGSPASLADTAPGAEVPLPPKAPSGRHASVATTSAATEASRQPKVPSGRHGSVSTAVPTTEASRHPKAPSGRHSPVGPASSATEASRQPKSPSGRRVSVAATSSATEAARQPKAPSGRHASVAATSSATEAARQPKAPSGRHPSVGPASSATEASRQPKAPSGRHVSVGTTSSAPEASRQPRSPSGRHAPVGATGADAVRQPKSPSGRHGSVASTSQDAEPPRRAASTKAPVEGPVSLAESAPAPSGMSRAAKPRAASTTAQEPTSTPGDAVDRKPRAAAGPPSERTTAFGAPLAPDAEPEARKAAAPEESTSQQASARNKNAGTQVREAPSRVERAPRAGHAPRVALSASGVEPPSAPRAPLSASGVEPPAAAPRAMGGTSSRPAAPKGRGGPEAPPDIPFLSQIPSEDEDEDAQELGAGPVEATSVIAWEAPPGRMDPVRRIHRAGRPEGTVSGPAPTRPQAGGRPTVGSTETRETPAATPDAAPPADATSAEPLVFKLVRERPLDPKPYRGLVDHFEQRGDATRAALMRELADALEGRDAPAPRVQRGTLTHQERAGLRHPGLRTPAGELLACVGIALCRLFPSPARIASTSEPLRASSGPGAAAVLDALNTAARLLGVPLPELVAGDDDTANITPLHTTTPRLVVGRLLVQQPPTNAELRFHAGRALFSLSPDLLALRALRKDHLLRALALLSSVLRNPKDAGDDARVVRESLSPRALERAALLMEPGTRDFDATLLVAAARDSANRAGLVACGGPGPALTALRARRPHESELEELVRFAASERYLALRDPAEAARGR
ncbi:hypothetical protein [Corallococcus sp. RDP092CA]|uniref:hypothetical protein n=1 Tax=Corallococcus sp. RDP092CA TaxID=3109369 RepID=UPI0035B2FCE6